MCLSVCRTPFKRQSQKAYTTAGHMWEDQKEMLSVLSGSYKEEPLRPHFLLKCQDNLRFISQMATVLLHHSTEHQPRD